MKLVHGQVTSASPLASWPLLAVREWRLGAGCKLAIAITLALGISVSGFANGFAPVDTNGGSAAIAVAQPSQPASVEAIDGDVSFALELDPSKSDPGLAKSVKSLPATSALFVMAYAPGDKKGMPVAVVRIPHPKLPAHFRIGPANAMTADTQFPTAVFLSAKLTARGDAITRPGDWTSDLDHPVAAHAGDKKVTLKLTRQEKSAH